MLSTLALLRTGGGRGSFCRAASFAALAKIVTPRSLRRHHRGERARLCARWGPALEAPTKNRARVYRARTSLVSRELGTAVRVEDRLRLHGACQRFLLARDVLRETGR